MQVQVQCCEGASTPFSFVKGWGLGRGGEGGHGGGSKVGARTRTLVEVDVSLYIDSYTRPYVTATKTTLHVRTCGGSGLSRLIAILVGFNVKLYLRIGKKNAV